MGKQNSLTKYFPCCFSLLENFKILELWDLSHFCHYPSLQSDVEGHKGSALTKYRSYFTQQAFSKVTIANC